MREKLPLQLARCDSTHPRARVPPRERRSHRIGHEWIHVLVLVCGKLTQN
jgi:hypothetical protein